MGYNIYGIPTCGTVKKAKAWLEDRGVPYSFVDFRRDPPTRDRVKGWVEAFGAKAMRNTSGKAYRSLPESKKEWSDDLWLERFVEDPMLIRRPVVERDGEPARVGWRGDDAQIAESLGLS